jgi:hypothetical protein
LTEKGLEFIKNNMLSKVKTRTIKEPPKDEVGSGPEETPVKEGKQEVEEEEKIKIEVDSTSKQTKVLIKKVCESGW